MDDLKSYICKICYDYPKKEVFQCRNGHWFCHECCPKLDNVCPSCRVSIKGALCSRNLFLEEILDTFQFNCPFLDFGCVEKMKRAELAEHRSSCKFGKTVQMCKLLNFRRCNFEVNRGNLSGFVTHMKDYHGILERNYINNTMLEKSKLCHFFNIRDPTLYSIILQYRSLTKILLVVKLEAEFVSWHFFDMKPGHVANDRTHDMEIHISSKQTPNTSWTIPVFSILDAEKLLNGPSVKTYVPSLRRICVPPIPEQNQEVVGNQEGIFDYRLYLRLIKKK